MKYRWTHTEKKSIAFKHYIREIICYEKIKNGADEDAIDVGIKLISVVTLIHRYKNVFGQRKKK